MNPKTCSYFYKAHCAASWLMKRGPFMQALGGMILNFSMSYAYAMVIQTGKRYAEK